jgi:hypothetical protein
MRVRRAGDTLPLELTAYLHPGWAPLIRPAPVSRGWMDATPEAFARRCLPLTIANAHGWEILNPHGFEATWDGGAEASAIIISPDPGGNASQAPVSLFGHGVITFHVEAIFRTPPGWNLWIGGSPNRAKDAIAPLTGIVETDWSPFTFTMNWRFTRPNQKVRFDAMEPFCFLFPLLRSAVEDFAPAFAPLDADPATAARFREWSVARDVFQAHKKLHPPKIPGDGWQKHYYRGIDASGERLIEDHRAKLRLQAFDRTATPEMPIAPLVDADGPTPAPADIQSPEIASLKLALAKRDWLLETTERQRALAPGQAGIERRSGMTSEEFLERYYAIGRPVILQGEMQDWPALTRWSPEYLQGLIGSVPVEYQGRRAASTEFERDKERHRSVMPFDAFIDCITGSGDSNDAYLTAYNAASNLAALAPLANDMDTLDKFLVGDPTTLQGMPWIGPAGTVTSLHHDLTNNFIAQIVGRKRLKILPASEVGRLYNDTHVFSRIADLDAPDLDLTRYPRLVGARLYDVVLEPGEILFMPLAWWHQVKAMDFSVSFTYTNFRWPNDGYATYPAG